MRPAPKPMRAYVMTRAWQLYRWNHGQLPFARVLRMAWAEAKEGRVEKWDFLPDEIRFPDPVKRLTHEIHELWRQRMAIEARPRLRPEHHKQTAALFERELALRAQRAAIDPRFAGAEI